MAVACTVPADAGRAGRRLSVLFRLVPAFGLLASAQQLLSGPPVWAEQLPSALMLVLQALTLLGGLLALRAAWLAGLVDRPRRTLHLGQDGQAHLTQPGEHPHFAGSALRLTSLSALPGLIVVVFAPISGCRPKLTSWLRPGPRPQVVLIAQDALTSEQWRRLHVWLVWVKRARHGLPAASKSPDSSSYLHP